MNRKKQICTLDLAAVAETPAAPILTVTECPTRKRLAKAAARLRNIDLVRNHRNDPDYGKSLEDKIIWRELLELELQQTVEGRDA